MGIVSRLELDHPSYLTVGTTALHAQIEGLYEKLGDNVDTRFFKVLNLAAAGTATIRHNFKAPFTSLYVKILAYNESTEEITEIPQSDYSITANLANPTQEIDITNNTLGEVDIAVVVYGTKIPLSELPDVSTAGILDGQVLVWSNLNQRFQPGTATTDTSAIEADIDALYDLIKPNVAQDFSYGALGGQDYNNWGSTIGPANSSSYKFAQSFSVPNADNLNAFQVQMLNDLGSNTGNIQAQVYADGFGEPDFGSPIGSASDLVDISLVGGSFEPVVFNFSTPVALSGGTNYWIVIDLSSVSFSTHIDVEWEAPGGGSPQNWSIYDGLAWGNELGDLKSTFTFDAVSPGGFTDLGDFSGAVISSNTFIKNALQELETYSESTNSASVAGDAALQIDVDEAKADAAKAKATIGNPVVISNTGAVGEVFLYFSTDRFGQLFKLDRSVVLDQLTMELQRTGSPTGNIKVAIKATTTGSNGPIPTGADLAVSDLVDVTTISTSDVDVPFVFSIPPTLQAGTYAFILQIDSGTFSFGNHINVNKNDVVSNLKRVESNNSGSTWNELITQEHIYTIDVEAAVDASVEDLGDFPGAIIPSNTNVKKALESLETHVEGLSFASQADVDELKTLTGAYETEVISALNAPNSLFDATSNVQSIGQVFKTDKGGVLSSFLMRVNKLGAPTGSVVGKLYLADGGTVDGARFPTGAELETSSNSIDLTTIPNSNDDITFNFSNTYLEPDQYYCVAFEYVGASIDIGNNLRLAVNTNSPLYGEGNVARTNDGVSWFSPGADTYFIATMVNDGASPLFLGNFKGAFMPQNLKIKEAFQFTGDEIEANQLSISNALGVFGSLGLLYRIEQDTNNSLTDLSQPTEAISQSFLAEYNFDVSSFEFHGRANGSPDCDYYFTIEETTDKKPNGTVIATSNINAASGLSPVNGYIAITFPTPPPLVQGVNYAVVLRVSNVITLNGSNSIVWNKHTTNILQGDQEAWKDSGGGFTNSVSGSLRIKISGEVSADASTLKLGPFTGGIIPDNSTIKEALQALETAIEGFHP